MKKIKVSSTNFENKKIMNEACPEVYAASILGTQWTLAICSYLVLGKHRFGELRKKIPGITERMLTLKLRELDKDRQRPGAADPATGDLGQKAQKADGSLMSR